MRIHSLFQEKAEDVKKKNNRIEGGLCSNKMSVFPAFDKSLKKEAATDANLVQIPNVLAICYMKTLFLPKSFPSNTDDVKK